MPQKSAITFGLVHIPVRLSPATQNNEISFNQLHKTDHERIRYKKICGHCGVEVTTADIVRGYQYEKDHYVVVTDAELEKIKTEKQKALTILHFCGLDEISPVYAERTLYAAPEPGGEKAFELLRAAMWEEGRVGIAHTVLGTKETLLSLIAAEDGLLVQTMFFEDEIREMPADTRPAVKAAEMTMAKQLINSMEQPFEPGDYRDEYQHRLREMIEQKIAGEQVVAPKGDRAGAASDEKIVDLMAALRASVKESIKPSGKKAAVGKSTAQKPAAAKPSAKPAAKGKTAAKKTPAKRPTSTGYAKKPAKSAAAKKS